MPPKRHRVAQPRHLRVTLMLSPDQLRELDHAAALENQARSTAAYLAVRRWTLAVLRAHGEDTE